VPDTLRNVGFMVKDAKRFPETDGWGYAQFDYVAVGYVQTVWQLAGVREGGRSPMPYACQTA
jgi:Cytochrome P460